MVRYYSYRTTSITIIHKNHNTYRLIVGAGSPRPLPAPSPDMILLANSKGVKPAIAKKKISITMKQLEQVELHRETLFLATW